MAKGNTILISQEPRGRFLEGIIDTAELPGTAVQIDTSQALVGGRHHWVPYNVAADGSRPSGPIIILLEDTMQGKAMTAAYTAAKQAFGYVPLPGDELNLLIGHAVVAGTATIAVGTVLIPDDGTGTFIPTTGSPEIEPAMTLEASADPGANALAWAIWSGY